MRTANLRTSFRGCGLMLLALGLACSSGCGKKSVPSPEENVRVAPSEVLDKIPKWKVSIEAGKSLAPGLSLDSTWKISFTIKAKHGPYGAQTTIVTFKMNEWELDWFPRDSRFGAKFAVNKYLNRTFTPADGVDWELGNAFNCRGVIMSIRVSGNDVTKRFMPKLAEATYRDGVISFKPGRLDWLKSDVVNLPAQTEEHFKLLVPPSKPLADYVPPAPRDVPDVSRWLNAPIANPVAIPVEDWGKIMPFVVDANFAEIGARRWNDPRLAASYFHGQPYDGLVKGIEDFTRRGVFVESYLHTEQSYPVAMRRKNDGAIEVDACEVWSKRFVTQTGDVLRVDPPHEVWQTITVKLVDGVGWRVIDIRFHREPLVADFGPS